ncbi:MAG TPA: response regulator [Ktedonobacterales bacterium]|jgi:CheY-like chemotaxis protein
MAISATLSPRLLLVEDDEELLAVLQDVLSEEGYAVTAVSSLDAALAEVNAQVFDLILSDVIGWKAEDPLQGVEHLRMQVQPTPVGLVTGWKLSEEAVKAKGFACLVSKPFELDDLLTLVAESVARPLTPEQERQAEVVRRYCEAIDARDWQTCVALCSDDVRYYPSPNSLFDRQKAIIGRDGVRDQLNYNQMVAPDFRYESYRFYGRPDGIAVRYHATIATPDSAPALGGGRQPLVGSIVFHVEGEQITQIGYRLGAAQLHAWTHVQQKGAQA